MSVREMILAPSLLAADFACLGDETRKVLEAGADWIHLDVMDNHFVPNLTVGPMVCSAIRPHTQRNGQPAVIDAHLMVAPVDGLIESFAKAGADYISFHPEASFHVHRTLQSIRALGCKSGLALNPATPIDCLVNLLDEIDMVLVMSVNPGFGGQSFIPHALSKLTQIRQMLDAYEAQTGRRIRLQVDGGVKVDNIAQIAQAGADCFVAGSAIFGSKDADGGYKKVMQKLRAQL